MHATLLIATLAALLSGPLWYAFAQRRPALLSVLDGFVLVSISGLVLIEVLPDAFGTGGWWSLGFLVLGLLGPTVLEHSLARARREAHLLALGLAILGLILHSIGDGAALSAEALHHGLHHGAHHDHAHHDHDHHGHDALGLAIAIHSVPVGLVVWWLLYPVFGAWLPALSLLAMCAATVAGYVFGASLAGLLGAQGWAWFQALIAGSILHVIFGRPHLDEAAAHDHSTPPFEGLGNLAALGFLIWLSANHRHEAAIAAELGLADAFLQVGLLGAPALMVAYTLIAVLSYAGLRRNRDEMPTQNASRTRHALHAGFVHAVDRSAAWVLAAAAVAAVVIGWHGLPSWAHLEAQPLQWICLAAIALLYAATLLRRGGRALISDLFRSGHGHAHS